MKKLLALVVLVMLFSSCGAYFSWHSEWSNDQKQKYLIQDANKRMYDYQWFYDQYAEIKATAVKVKIAKGTEEEKGIKMVLATMIEEYNSRSNQIYRDMWKAEDLPHNLTYEGVIE